MSDTDLKESFMNTEQGSKILKCIQCGTCSGSCPLAGQMDHAPRALFAMIRDGEMTAALESETPWLCVSCYQCTARCPQEIPVTDLIYSLKRLSLKHGASNKGTHMNQAFSNTVKRFGRSSESVVMAGYALKHPMAGVSKIPLALRFIGKKRVEFKPQEIADPKRMKTLLKHRGEDD